MNYRIRHIGCSIAFVLMACLTDERVQFPDLNREDVVGCWSEINPTSWGCVENCFDSTGLFYSKTVSNFDSTSFVESIGNYYLNGNAIRMSHFLVPARDPTRRDSVSWLNKYARVQEKLVMLEDGGRSLSDIQYSRVNMATECGGAWKNIQKPLDWRLP